jgi:hypothetical protein
MLLIRPPYRQRQMPGRFRHDGTAVTNRPNTSTQDRQVVVLKSGRFTAAAAQDGRLPYRIDELEQHGYRLVWTDAHLGRRWRGPWAQTWSVRAARRRAQVTLAIFESEGHPAALLRSLVPRRLRRGRLIVISCWLGELVRTATRPKRLVYRWIYRGVDLVTVFSENQVPIVETSLRLAAGRRAAVTFGVDVDELDQLQVSEVGCVVAVGRDLGRDWRTLFSAVEGTGWTVRVVTREQQVDGLDVPAEAVVQTTMPRAEYLTLLAGATVVVIATHELAYPTGQSVMLEAMALGKACVVTGTAAMAGYAHDGVNCLTAAPGDAGHLRAQIQLLLDDSGLRRRLGEAAQERARGMFTTQQMWAQIAAELDRLLAAPAGRARA